jgi:hypothetical protein
VLTESQRKQRIIREVQGLDSGDTGDGPKGSPEKGDAAHERLR